jgi:hypothetical protein
LRGALEFHSADLQTTVTTSYQVTHRAGIASVIEDAKIHLLRSRKPFCEVSQRVDGYAIHASNASGFARTTDDVVGDPRQRARALSYCLFHDAKAICGEGQVMNLSDQKANFLPTALKILRSVEFVDVEPNDRSASGATGMVTPIGKSTHEK